MSLKAATLHFSVQRGHIDEHRANKNVAQVKDSGACADLNAANIVITNDSVAARY